MLLILLVAAGVVLETVFISLSYKRRSGVCTLFKTVASACFVAVGFACGMKSGFDRFSVLVIWGLGFGMLGDFLLALRFLWKKTHTLFFVSGTLAFFTGHIFYILAILQREPRAWLYAIPISLAAMGAAGFYNWAKEVRPGKILPLGIVYIFEVLFMASCAAVGAFLDSSRSLFLFFLGGLCFALSDNMLVVLSFGKNDSPYRNAVLHVLYYMAQVFIALSLMFAA